MACVQIYEYLAHKYPTGVCAPVCVWVCECVFVGLSQNNEIF